MTKPLASLALSCIAVACAQTRGPQPPQVDPGGSGKAPSDATALFDGTTLDAWVRRDGGPPGCQIADHEMVCRTGAKDIMTKAHHTSAQIHVEFKLPSMLDQKSQLRANSGVYLQGRYEVQVLDSLNNPTYANGSAGALYGQQVPLANPSLGPEKWQTFDIVFHAPRCESGVFFRPGSLTLLFNGVLVQDHVPVEKATGGAVTADVCTPGPLLLQDHSGFPGAPATELRFRNIWIRKLSD